MSDLQQSKENKPTDSEPVNDPVIPHKQFPKVHLTIVTSNIASVLKASKPRNLPGSPNVR